VVGAGIARPSSIGNIVRTKPLVPADIGRAMPAPTSINGNKKTLDKGYRLVYNFVKCWFSAKKNTQDRQRIETSKPVLRIPPAEKPT